MIKDYFISFTKKDEQWAKWVAWELKSMGHTFDFQCYDFVPGSNFISKMNLALKKSRQLISIWSREYFKSKYATWEMNAAFSASNGYEIKVIPVRVENCRIDTLYKPFVFIDFVNKSKFEAKRLLKEGLDAARIGVYASKNFFDKKPPAFPGERNAIHQDMDAPDGIKEKTIKVLFTGSEKASGLDLRGQQAILKKAMLPLIKSKKLKFISKLDLNTHNIFETLEKINPHILHFSGKQEGGNILLEDRKGFITKITDKQLAGLIRSLGGNLKLGIIDTCYSYTCAKHISTVIDFSIGIKGFIYEDESNNFFERFYTAICNGKTLANAVKIAGTRLKFEKLPDARIPALFNNRKADPALFKFV